ncbi:hypothetical protein P3W85_20610 [Cupriavidus basilensis]|uniref:ApeI dehydratase-like domain-containing protein n=1 Tax=Cupriavidus basilensis TaxID=68895 RepID=A0ABT6ARX7_9BURK|nr:hypothetical protein [Cupriavidus basilensis]MDF3835338.1 hypothetical protein [Cupriavidus basilensis]
MNLFPNSAAGMRLHDQAHALSERHWVFIWHFSQTDAVFDGHFPHQPVLAGVFLMEMAQRAMAHAVLATDGRAVRLRRVSHLRFFNAVFPGETCALTVTWESAAGDDGRIVAEVRFAKGRTKVAAGLLELAVVAEQVSANEREGADAV